MSCLTLEPRFLNAQPLWWSRHIDFHTSCLIYSFVKTHFEDVLSNLLTFNFRFSELQNCALFLGCPLSKMQNCGAIRFLAFSELQNCALFLVVPLSKLQNCGEFRPLHPGSWAEASKSCFRDLAPKPYVSLTF